VTCCGPRLVVLHDSTRRGRQRRGTDYARGELEEIRSNVAFVTGRRGVEQVALGQSSVYPTHHDSRSSFLQTYGRVSNAGLRWRRLAVPPTTSTGFFYFRERRRPANPHNSSLIRAGERSLLRTRHSDASRPATPRPGARTVRKELCKVHVANSVLRLLLRDTGGVALLGSSLQAPLYISTNAACRPPSI
jgi:hypothetical protein